MHISTIENVAQMSKPIKVKVVHVQYDFYSINVGIYRWYPAIIPIFDIFIGFGVMAGILKPLVGIFRIMWVFFVPPAPTDKKSKF